MFKKGCLLFFLMFATVVHAGPSKHAICQGELTGRFGDQLLAYAQARYLSYLTAIPFLFRPIAYDDQISLDFQTLPYDSNAHQYVESFTINSANSLFEFFRKIADFSTPPTLFVVEYFPNEIAEWDIHNQRSIILEDLWTDYDFREFLRKGIKAKIPIPDLHEEGCLNVAVHVRTLSGADTLQEIINAHLKIVNLAYHRSQILKVHKWNNYNPLHVFLFSDTKQPRKLLENFRKYFKNTNISFDIQILKEVDKHHVIQDFFAMQKFDVLVATRSNLSSMAAILGNFDMVFFPIHTFGNYPDLYVDRIRMMSRISTWFPYNLNIIMKEENVIKTNHDWFPEAS